MSFVVGIQMRRSSESITFYKLNNIAMKHLITHVLLFIICCEALAQSSSGMINFSDTSKWRLIPDRDVCIADTSSAKIDFRSYKLIYNDELYISNYDLQYILYNIKEKSKCQKAPSQENSLIRVFHWEDIYECVKKKIIGRFTVCDPPIRWSPLLCDKCKRNTVNFYYSSPEWTWKERCGISGEMFLCPFCVRQVEFLGGIMN